LLGSPFATTVRVHFSRHEYYRHHLASHRNRATDAR